MKTQPQSSGQAAVLSAVFLFVTIAFLLMAINTGVLITDKIRTQNTADLSAYAAAYQQAATMNQISMLSEEIYIRVQKLRYTLNMGKKGKGMYWKGSWGPYIWDQPRCSCEDTSPQAEGIIEDAQSDIETLIHRIQKLNAQGALNAQKAARLTALRNLPQLKQGGSISFFQNVPGSPGAAEDVVSLRQVKDTQIGYSFFRRCCCEGRPETKDYETRFLSVPSWVYKGERQVYMPVKVKYRGEGHLIGRDYFLPPDSTDEQQQGSPTYGYALAKPYEGILGTKNPDNATEEVRTAGAPQEYAPFRYFLYPPSDDLLDYFHPTYRARVAGFHEDMGAGTSAAALVATDPSEPQFQSKTDYLAH